MESANRQTFRKILSLSITEIETETNLRRIYVVHGQEKLTNKMGEITVRVNPDYFPLIKTSANEYTKFPLQIGIVSVNNIPSIVYKFLRQFAGHSVFWADGRKLQTLFEDPDSYGATKIRGKIINPALEELKEFYPNLRLEEVKAKRKEENVVKPKVTSYRFHFDKEARDAWEDNKAAQSKEKNKRTKWSKPDYVNETSEESRNEATKAEMLAKLDDPRNTTTVKRVVCTGL